MDSHPASLAISVSCIYYQRATLNSQMTKHQPKIPKHPHVTGMSNIESFGVGSIRTFTCRSSSTTTVTRIWCWNRSNVATDDGTEDCSKSATLYFPDCDRTYPTTKPDMPPPTMATCGLSLLRASAEEPLGDGLPYLFVGVPAKARTLVMPVNHESSSSSGMTNGALISTFICYVLRNVVQWSPPITAHSS